jgi:GMP synthase (glutamine-hydrolysing)
VDFKVGPILFIDSFINDPVNHCVNEFVERTSYPVTYHQPAKYGFGSLKALKQTPIGIVILGSASHVTQNCSWHSELLDWLIPFLNAGVPVFGICFGHQLLANYYGGEVGHIDEEKTQFTQARTLSFKTDFLGIRKGEDLVIPYAHQQIVKSLPMGFDVVAHSENLAYEVLKHQTNPIFLMQGHPESSLEFIKDELGNSNAISSEAIKENGNKILDGFLKFCQDR